MALAFVAHLARDLTGFRGWRPLTKNLIFSREVTTSLFYMSNSDNSNNNNNTQPKILEVEELTKMQYLQKIAEAEAEAEEEEEEKEIDLVHLKYRSPDHLPTKLSFKQIQEF